MNRRAVFLAGVLLGVVAGWFGFCRAAQLAADAIDGI